MERHWTIVQKLKGHGLPIIVYHNSASDDQGNQYVLKYYEFVVRYIITFRQHDGADKYFGTREQGMCATNTSQRFCKVSF